jgi:hypothetical protein
MIILTENDALVAALMAVVAWFDTKIALFSIIVLILF